MALTAETINRMNQEQKDHALYTAASSGVLEDVNALLGAGANPLIKYRAQYYSNSLEVAAERGHLNVVERLLELPQVVAQVSDNKNLAMYCAADQGHTTILRRLLQFPDVVENIDATILLTLYQTLEEGNVETLKCLTEVPKVAEMVRKDAMLAMAIAQVTGNTALAEQLTLPPQAIQQMNEGIQSLVEFSEDDNMFYQLNLMLENSMTNKNINGETRQILEERGFYDWQASRRQALLASLKLLISNGIPADITVDILTLAFPEFSGSVIRRQGDFIKNSISKQNESQALVFSSSVNGNPKRQLDKQEGNTAQASYEPKAKRQRKN